MDNIFLHFTFEETYAKREVKYLAQSHTAKNVGKVEF